MPLRGRATSVMPLNLSHCQIGRSECLRCSLGDLDIEVDPRITRGISHVDLVSVRNILKFTILVGPKVGHGERHFDHSSLSCPE